MLMIRPCALLNTSFAFGPRLCPTSVGGDEADAVAGAEAVPDGEELVGEEVEVRKGLSSEDMAAWVRSRVY
jgi:hypothetical protein